MSKSRIASAIVVLTLGFMLGMAVDTPVTSLPSRASAITEASSSGIQGTQRAWEYRVMVHYISWGESRLETELNNLGRQGFEVSEMMLFVVPSFGDERNFRHPDRLLVVLRRPGR
jgi:hypothetical protein